MAFSARWKFVFGDAPNSSRMEHIKTIPRIMESRVRYAVGRNLRQSRVRGRLRLLKALLIFRIRSAMNETKADMYGSYLAVFSFAIVMVALPLFFDSKVGSVLWAFVAWQIYRRDKSTLIVTVRLLFWFIVIGAIVSMVWLLLGPPNVNLRQFVEAEGLGLAISAGALWWMHSYFEKSPTAADIFNAVVAEEPASADMTTVESPAPRPDANIAVAQAPASAGIATAESPARKPLAENIRTRVIGRAKRVMSWRRRPPQPASAGNPPAVSPKTVPPESHGTIPLPTIIDDERIYAGIAGELETGGIDKGLWTRLFAECDGDEKRTKVLYIRQRAERLIAAERARRSK